MGQTKCHACRQATDTVGYCVGCDEFSHQGKPLPPDPRDAVVDAAREAVAALKEVVDDQWSGGYIAAQGIYDRLREALRGLGEGVRDRRDREMREDGECTQEGILPYDGEGG